MGTRCLTILPGYDGETAVLYRQFDGYPEGHGAELADYLRGFAVVNGLGADPSGVANGPDCLSALIVSHFKGQEAGSFYLMPAGTRDVGEEYRYTVTAQADRPIGLKVESGYAQEWRTLYDGPVDAYAVPIDV